MTGPEFAPSQEEILDGYLCEINALMGEHYGVADSKIGAHSVHLTDAPLADSTEDVTGIGIEGGAFIVNSRKLEYFQEQFFGDIEDVVGNKDTAGKMYIGLAVAGQVALEIFSRETEKLNPLKASSHLEMLTGFFNQAGDIHETFKNMFVELIEDDGNAGVTLQMTKEANPEDVAIINGLRFKMHILMQTPGIPELLGFNYRQLVDRSREQIQINYQRDRSYFRTITRGLVLNEKLGDSQFFDHQPHWLVAAAVPLRKAQIEQLFSDAWAY